jgi:Zn-dependent protease
MPPDFVTLLAQALMVLIPLVLSLSVHECAHAWAAARLGDRTAAQAGRLTLSPLPHIDPVGTIALPLIIMLAQGGMGSHALPFIGWAKPTPVDGARFTRRIAMHHGHALVALAGPASNLVLGLACALALAALRRAPIDADALEPLWAFGISMIFMNAGLMVFNLLPLPPLDGASILGGVLPRRMAATLERVGAMWGQWALLLLVLFGRSALQAPVRRVAQALLHVVALGG